METVPTPPPPPLSPVTIAPEQGSYQRPADYYATPPAPSGKNGCPRWLIFGCGGLGCFTLVAMFVLGSFAMKSGGGAFFGWLFNQLEEQSVRAMTEDVTAEQKSAFKREIDRLQSNLRQRRVDLGQIQTILKALQSGIKDDRLDAREVDELIRIMKEANDRVGGSGVETRTVSIDGVIFSVKAGIRAGA